MNDVDSMKPEDLYLAPNMPFFRGSTNAQEGPPRITYIHLRECDKFSVIFYPVLFLSPKHADTHVHVHMHMHFSRGHQCRS